MRAIFFEIFAILGDLILRSIPFRQTTKGEGQPILLVHGYLHNGNVWLVQKKRLEALGFGPIYTIHLGHPFQSLEAMAEKVKLKAAWIAKETGRNDLILIGHSMGGLVSVLYATRMAPKGTVTDVITLASPLSGTPVAKLGVGKSAREMEPHTQILIDLRKAIHERKEIRFFHIATLGDLIVPGDTAAFLENRHFIIEDLGHEGLLYSRRVTAKIVEFLTSSGDRCRLSRNSNLNP
jgi:triacylglycerol lipase